MDPRRAPSPRPAPNAWARVRLLKGESAGGLWDVTSDVPEARIAVGTDGACGWVVSAAGVAPMHFELFWDGTSLWVGNPRSARDLTLDGEPLGDWAAVTGKARLEFGRAAMLIETSSLASSVHSDSLAPAMPAPQDDRTMVRPPAADMRSRLAAPTQSSYVSGSTGLHRMPPDSRPPPEDVAAENTRIAPGLTGGAPPGRHAMAGPPPDPAATRVIAFDEMERRPAAAPRVGLGTGGAPMTDDRPTRGIGGQSVPAIATEATRLGVSPQLPPGYGAPPPTYISPAAPPTPTAPPPNGAAQGAAMGLAPTPEPQLIAGGFAAPPPPPPTPTAGQTAANLTEKLKIALKPEQGGKPTSRTWLLLALVVAVVVVFFVLDDDPPQVAAPEDGGGVAQPVVPAVPVPPYALPGVPAPVQPTPFGAPYGAQIGVPIVPPLPPDPPPPDPNVRHPRGYSPPPLPPTEERIAADLVAAGRWRDALPHYQTLAAQNPGDRTYPLIVSILSRRLAVACVNGLTPTGAPCTGL